MLGVPKFPKGSSVPCFLLLAALALSSCSQAAVKSSDVTVKTVPSVVHTSPQGTYLEPTWDYGKLGPNKLPYRTDGSSVEDYWAYGEPVLAAADGRVVRVRNDILEYGIGKLPSLDAIVEDTDILAGNLVILDHGNGEYSLTCHMKPGSISIKAGDQVKAGEVMGQIGGSGNVHPVGFDFNLMDGPEWIDAKGLPPLLSNFELVPTAGPPKLIELGNPRSGWGVRPAE